MAHSSSSIVSFWAWVRRKALQWDSPPGTSTTTLIVENRTSDPGSPAAGQVWLRTDL